MKGQYTTDELQGMAGIISSVKQWADGYCVRKVGHTVNYYRRETDGSWTNYDCRTVY